MLQLQFHPQFRLLVIKPSILSVLITQWQLSAINLNTLPQLCTTTIWHHPTLKPWSPLILQVQSHPLSKPPVITPSTKKCAYNLMETQCNQPQHLIPLNKICAHIPTASQNNQVSLSNSLASPYPPDPGEHV